MHKGHELKYSYTVFIKTSDKNHKKMIDKLIDKVKFEMKTETVEVKSEKNQDNLKNWENGW